MSNKLIPLAFLYTKNRDSIEGATRFQKLVFLAQEEGELPEKYSYHADKFGPFSPELHEDLTHLQEKGLIERNTVTNEVGNPKHVYSLTVDGIKMIQSLLSKGKYERLFDAIQDIKTVYNDDPLDQLLRYVYKKYPEYTVETELDQDRLFDPDTKSQFLEPSSETDFVGTEPGDWKELNPSAEAFFSVE